MTRNSQEYASTKKKNKQSHSNFSHSRSTVIALMFKTLAKRMLSGIIGQKLVSNCRLQSFFLLISRKKLLRWVRTRRESHELFLLFFFACYV